MDTHVARASEAPSLRIGFREFVALIAALMAINALGIDVMLPALPKMGAALGIEDENQRQWIIAAYMFGFGAAQLIYGPLADRHGRRPVLLTSLVLFALASFAATFAYDFETIVIARALQGVACASARVLAISIVRDCYQGRQMARVMSLAFIVFLAVPILAPSIGQAIMLVAPWQWIFHALAIYAVILIAWMGLRLPETLHPEDRRAIAPREIATAAKLVLTDRFSLGYTLASTLMFGSLIGFINSAQQIFADVFEAARYFTLVFAGVAGFMGLSSFLNSRIVERLGTRRVSHTALLGFIAVAAGHVAVAAAGAETLVTFSLFQAATMFCFGLAGSNFGSMAMEPVGHIAGTASSIQGFISTLGGTAIGLAIGQSFNGTSLPVAAGYLIVGVLALVVVLVTERGRLFQARNAAVPQAS
jgi:DHA1 family bicyclomycin/chloramphenicol resistance-like MFS transporter